MINVFQKWLHISLWYSIFVVNMVLFFPMQKVAGAKIFTFSMPELEKVIALKFCIFPMFHETFVYIGWFPSCDFFLFVTNCRRQFGDKSNWIVFEEIFLEINFSAFKGNVNYKLDQTNRFFLTASFLWQCYLKVAIWYQTEMKTEEVTKRKHSLF